MDRVAFFVGRLDKGRDSSCPVARYFDERAREFATTILVAQIGMSMFRCRCGHPDKTRDLISSERVPPDPSWRHAF
jgi:hypothetical protein